MISVSGKTWNILDESADGSVVSRLLRKRQLAPLDAGIDALHSPFLLKDIQKAVERVIKAIADGKRIMIFGDYDVDGVTSCAITYQILKSLGANVSVRIPNRFTDGYGLNMGFIEECKELGVDLIITVDCGISNVQEVALAARYGIDCIVTDHHEPPAVLPFAFAIINPKQPGCGYPEKRLAGAGVAWKFMQAVLTYAKKSVDGSFDYLDLVALATTADCMPLLGENRILVKHGLEKMRLSPHKGLKGLIKQTGIEGKKYSPYTYGFQLGPPINAAGRLDSALDAFHMLVDTPQLAEKLYRMNVERQSMVADALEEAEEMIGTVTDETCILMVGSENWGIGIIGLVAGKLCEKYRRPTIVMTKRNDEIVGSARSISGYHMVEALTRHKKHLLHYGGHEMAAGFSLSPAEVAEFTENMEHDAYESLSGVDLSPKLHIDTVLKADEMNFETVNDIARLEPFGMGNPTPLFYVPRANIFDVKTMGKDSSHVSFGVTYGTQKIRAVAFGMGVFAEKLSQNIGCDLAVALDENEWNGEKRLQLMVKDVRITNDE
jgi:single-stranded-DNA-specific exonuclease